MLKLLANISKPSRGSIQVKGKIECCQRLTVEGHVEAAMAAETLEVLAKGLFEGTAEVDNADIAGTFDGVLIVREQMDELVGELVGAQAGDPDAASSADQAVQRLRSIRIQRGEETR